MWPIVKSELKYNWKEFLALAFFLLLYTIVVLFNYPIGEHAANGWADIFGWSFYAYYYIIFMKRLRTKRLKHFALLPLANKNIGVSRLLFSTLPFIIPIIYFVLIQFVIIESKLDIIVDLILKLGVMLSIIASFTLLRDSWFSYSDLGEKLGAVFIIGVIVFGLLLTLTITIQTKHESIIPILGLPNDNIQIFLLGFVTMLATIFSYQKRKTYLI